MDDRQIRDRIEALVDEEHRLLKAGGEGGLAPDEHARLRQVTIELDTCWDLLRQRRARREAGQSPDLAEPRPPGTVEGYLQ